VQAKSELVSHISCSCEWKKVEGTNLKLPSELSLWELKSQWTPKSLEGDCRGQNSLDWKVPYIIGNILEHRCLKLVCMTHLDTSNTSYGQKKSQESNWQFDSQPLKVGNRLDFLVFRWCATYRWKSLDEDYNFALDLISIGGFHTKLWAFKIVKVPTLGISRLPLGSPGTRWHLGVGPMARHMVYYKGEGGGFPQVRAMVNFVSSCLFVACPCTKGF